VGFFRFLSVNDLSTFHHLQIHKQVSSCSCVIVCMMLEAKKKKKIANMDEKLMEMTTCGHCSNHCSCWCWLAQSSEWQASYHNVSTALCGGCQGSLLCLSSVVVLVVFQYDHESQMTRMCKRLTWSVRLYISEDIANQ